VWNGLASNPHHLWAFRRAELTAFTYSPFRNLDGRPTVMAQVRQLDPRSFGAERLVELLRLGLRGLVPSLEKLPKPGPIGVVLGLPERMSDGRASARDRHIRRRIEDALSEALAQVGLEHILRVEARGHASGVYAALQAADSVLSRVVPAAVVCGIDSSYDPLVVQELLEQDRILDTGHLDAMIPGEGVAFALVTMPSTARQCGLPVLALLEGAAVNHEPATVDNDVGLLGLGLSRAAVLLGNRLRREDRRLDWWISDMTPESFRVQELQLAWPRAARGLMEPTSTLEHLPHHLGDLGAATIPTGIAVATEGFRRGDPQARTCFLTGSSDGGDRGVLLLARAE
jgi:3-oxoacyl-[acyl-carrier-protein] synthase-1